MKRKSYLLLTVLVALATALFALSGCEKRDPPKVDPVNYTVTYQVNGGTAVDPKTVDEGTRIDAPSVTKGSFILEGWYESADFSGKAVKFPYKVTKNVTLHAKWTMTVTNRGEYQDEVKISYVIGGYEWGPAIQKMVIDFGNDVYGSSIDKETFAVSGVSQVGFPPVASKFDKTITATYLSDKDGTKITKESSKFVTIDFKVGYESVEVFPGFAMGSVIEGGGALNYDMATGGNSWVDFSTLFDLKVAGEKTFQVDDGIYTGIKADKISFDRKIIPSTIGFEKDTYTHSADNITLQRGAYSNDAMKNDGVKNALIIWLHGAGEGGTDIDIALLGNDVTNLAENKIQRHFIKAGGEQGAYVLAVQTPTMWMDSGSGQHQGTEDSIYTAALWEAIKDYVSNNSDIDTNRIYVGGCSNGGYMTMNLLFQGGTEYFAAAYPICQAYADSYIDETKLNTIKNFPIWFTASADDSTVAIAGYTNPTYKRLIIAGAKNVHYSLFEKVIGTDAPGVEYMGHFSWVYTLQDQAKLDQDAQAIAGGGDVKAPSSKKVIVNGKEASLWAWIAAQSKAK